MLHCHTLHHQADLAMKTAEIKREEGCPLAVILVKTVQKYQNRMRPVKRMVLQKLNNLGKKAVEKAVLVSEGVTSPNHNKSEKLIDPGMITSIEGTPSKIYPSLGEMQSPILSRFGRQNTK